MKKKIFISLSILIVLFLSAGFFIFFKTDKELTEQELVILSKRLFSQAAEEFHTSWTYSLLDPTSSSLQWTVASVLKTVYTERDNFFVQVTESKQDQFGTGWIIYTSKGSPFFIFQMVISKYKTKWYISNISIKPIWNNIQPLSEKEKQQVDALISKLKTSEENELLSMVQPILIQNEQDGLLFKNIIISSRDLVNNQNCPLFYSDNSINEIKKFIPDYAGDKAFVVECTSGPQKIKISITQDSKIMGYQIR